MSHDLRSFLDAVRARGPASFQTISREVDPRWELSALQKRLEAEGRRPVLFFERVKGSALPVVTNVFTREHLALALGVKVPEVARRLADGALKAIPPRPVTTGPVKDVKRLGDAADLRELPIVTHCEKDAGPYITAGVTIMRDPVSGALNAGLYRNSYLGPRTLTMNVAPLSHGAEIVGRARERGVPVEAAIVIGHHPALLLASQYRGKLGEFELDVAGGLLGEPVDVVPAETVDVPVPAFAEIVIEGRILPDRWEDDGPFGEYFYYYAPPKKAPVFEVTAITRRSDAVYLDIFNVGSEHVVLFSLGMEALVLSRLQELIPQVVAVHVPPSGAASVVYVQIRKDMEGLGVNAALAALGVYRFKYAVVVDEDVDIYDDSSVLWAITTRTEPNRSFFIVPGSYVSRGDPMAYAPAYRGGPGPRILSTRMGIDATRPLDPDFPEVAEPPRELWRNLRLDDYLKPGD